MNPRIREIMVEAGYAAPEIAGRAHKLADLIVRECIRTIQLNISRDGQTTEKYLRSMRHIKDIKEKFGVEE